jgi:uracil-DNA glycosylase
MAILTEEVYNWQERILMPMYHPAYALRIGGMKEYKEDFKFRIKMIQQLEDKL